MIGVTRGAAVLALALAAGCAASPPRTLYAWGTYEEMIYDAHVKPGSVTVHDQIEQLEAHKATTAAANKALPPGWHAHLGYLYFEDGKADAARAELNAEKAAFPESATFVDRLLANMNQPPVVKP